MQLGSDALFGPVVSADAPSARVPRSVGLAIYRALDRVAPAPYVEEMLARAAIADGDLAGAQRYAVRLPASPSRNELLARIADARGQSTLALEYYLVAPDVDAVGLRVAALARDDPRAAYALESELLLRLQALTTHPDAVAEAYWRLGRLATLRGYLRPADRAEAWRLGLADYRKAVALAPLSEKYLLAVGNELVLLEDWPAARAAFQRALDVDPRSGDARAGLALAARNGTAGP